MSLLDSAVYGSISHKVAYNIQPQSRHSPVSRTLAIPQPIPASKHFCLRWKPHRPKFHPGRYLQSSIQCSRSHLSIFLIPEAHSEPLDNSEPDSYEEMP